MKKPQLGNTRYHAIDRGPINSAPLQRGLINKVGVDRRRTLATVGSDRVVARISRVDSTHGDHVCHRLVPKD